MANEEEGMNVTVTDDVDVEKAKTVAEEFIATTEVKQMSKQDIEVALLLVAQNMEDSIDSVTAIPCPKHGLHVTHLVMDDYKNLDELKDGLKRVPDGETAEEHAEDFLDQTEEHLPDVGDNLVNKEVIKKFRNGEQSNE